MFEDRDLKILLGNSIGEDEVDYDSAAVKSELGYPVEEEALKEFYYTTIINNVGKSDFRENYLSVIQFAQQYSLKSQQVLVNSILEQIQEVYEFIPSQNFDPYNYDEINEVYKFIEFLEYDHEDFIVEVWSFLKPETNSLQLEKYCEQNKYKIIFEVEEQLDSRFFPWLIADFLRTNNKENLIEWFCEKSMNLRGSILLSLYKE
jgi:hypothetical protein